MSDGSRNEFGALLREARQKRGVTLQEVAATTKISARLLDALERNDHSKLPGGIFSRSFVRAYAREIGLDPEDAVRRFVAAFPPEAEDAAPAAASRAIDAETYESGRRTAMMMLRILGIAILVLGAVLVYMKMRQSPTVPPPVTAAPPVVQPPSPAQPQPDAEVAPGVTTAPAGRDREPEAETPPATPAVEPPAAPPAFSEAVSEPAAVPEPAPITLSIFASEACWLSLSVDGRKVIGRNLEPGERVQFRARATITMVSGNAGALTVTINGKPARPIGDRGAVVTTTITLDTLKDLIL